MIKKLKRMFVKFLKLPITKKIDIILDWPYSYLLVLIKLLNYKEKRSRLSKKYRFVNRKKDHENLLLIVAGYQEYYWDVLLERIYKISTLNGRIDVCVACPGIDNEHLNQICEKYNWSILITKDNKLSLAQNIAIKIHEKAKWIYKIDEDIVISKDFFTSLHDTYIKIEKEGRNDIGFVAPLININGYSYIYFLEAIDQLESYEQQFGQAKSRCVGLKAQHDPEAALFLSNHSVPFDQVAEKIYEKYKGEFSICPHRFSIGAILFKRQTWEKLGMFKVGLNGGLGIEEQQFCNYCVTNSEVMVVAKEAFVGHLGFGPQKESIRRFFEENQRDFMYPKF